MEDYLPFLNQHWRTLALMASSLVAGIAIGKCQPNLASRLPSTKKPEVQQRQKESADDEDDEPFVQSEIPYALEVKPRILYQYVRPSVADCTKRSADFYQRMKQRRGVRNFSTDPVPREIIENIIKTAGDFYKYSCY